jgi:hypothetical protein
VRLGKLRQPVDVILNPAMIPGTKKRQDIYTPVKQDFN